MNCAICRERQTCEMFAQMRMLTIQVEDLTRQLKENRTSVPTNDEPIEEVVSGLVPFENMNIIDVDGKVIKKTLKSKIKGVLTNES